MKIKHALYSLGILCLSAGAAEAQWVYNDGAATVGESYARGMADLVRSAGEANLNNSAAAINYSQAESMQMDNQLQYTETYFEMRRVNREARAAEQGPPVTAEQAARISASRMPDRLSVSQLDPVSGAISWPTALQMEAFADDRNAIDSLVSTRAESAGSIGPDAYMEIQTHIRSMKQTLNGMARQLDATIFTNANKFLDSLGYEVRFAAS